MATIAKAELYSALAEKHGMDLQAKLGKASVAICGLGGLGSNIAIALARAGIGRLHLIDFDVVEISNLNRQQYTLAQIGIPKAEALLANLRAINPYVEYHAEQMKITEENIPSLLKEETIICEAFDKAEQKAMLVDTVLEHFPEKYLVSGSGMAGRESANRIQTRKITEHFILCGDQKSDVDLGLSLIGARVLVCASHQATAIIRLIGEME